MGTRCTVEGGSGKEPVEEHEFRDAPGTPDSLHEWIATHLGVRIARRAVVGHHSAPFDYVCHAFFEGQTADGVDAAAGAARGEASPDCTLWANRGGGKTFLAAVATLLDLLFKKGCQVRVLAGSVEQGLRMHAHLRALLDREAFSGVGRRVTARRIELTWRKSAVEILAASQTSVRGTRVQKLRCDEVDLFDPEVWEAAQLVTRSLPNVQGPWGTSVRGAVEALSTMHVPQGLMWKIVGDGDGVMAKEEEGAREPAAHRRERRLFRWGLLDVLEECPAERACGECVLEPECRGRAKGSGRDGHVGIDDAVWMKKRVGRETWETEMLCLRPSRGSTVYPSFDPALHVRAWEPERTRFARVIAGMDFGYRSESVVLLAGMTARGRVHVIREHARTEQTVRDQIEALERWRAAGLFRFARDVGGAPVLELVGIDPAGNAADPQTGKASSTLLRERGYPVRTQGSEIYEGVVLVRDRLDPAWKPRVGEPRFGGDEGEPRLVIDPGCTRLIECLRAYRFDPGKPESTTPLKDGFDHACDALRYMVLNLDRVRRTTVRGYAGSGTA